MSDVEPAEPPAILGEEPVAETIAEEVVDEPVANKPVAKEAVAETPVAKEPAADELIAKKPPTEDLPAEELNEATPAEAEPVPEQEKAASDPGPPPAVAAEEDTPTSQPENAPAFTPADPEATDDIPVELDTKPHAAPAEPLTPIPEDAPAPLQKAASVPVEAEPAPVAKSATTPSQAAAAPLIPDPAEPAEPETTPASDLSTAKTEVAKAAAAADTKSLAPSRKVRAKAKILGKIVPKVAAFRAPKEVAPILVLLTQKKKAGVDINPIVDNMLKVAGA